MRIAVIGMGSIGQRHYRNLKALGYSPRGWDIDPSRGDPIDWAWKPEVVLVCTPPETHTLIALQALSVNPKGLFVEKPLSDKLDRPELLLQEGADGHQTITMVGANWRFRSGMQDLLFRPGPLRITASVPIPVGRRTSLAWDVTIHWIDLEAWATREGFGHKDFQSVSTYAEPYLVAIKCGDKERHWTKGNNAMYLSEMRHFLHCVKTGQPTGNDFAQAAETLKLALGVNDA